MPQLDIILWFSQVFWLVFFFLSFISFVFILYIPISYCMDSFPLFKKIDHLNISNLLILLYSGNIQDFFYLYRGIR